MAWYNRNGNQAYLKNSRLQVFLHNCILRCEQNPLHIWLNRYKLCIYIYYTVTAGQKSRQTWYTTRYTLLHAKVGAVGFSPCSSQSTFQFGVLLFFGVARFFLGVFLGVSCSFSGPALRFSPFFSSVSDSSCSKRLSSLSRSPSLPLSLSPSCSLLFSFLLLFLSYLFPFLSTSFLSCLLPLLSTSFLSCLVQVHQEELGHGLVRRPPMLNETLSAPAARAQVYSDEWFFVWCWEFWSHMYDRGLFSKGSGI